MIILNSRLKDMINITNQQYLKKDFEWVDCKTCMIGSKDIEFEIKKYLNPAFMNEFIDYVNLRWKQTDYSLKYKMPMTPKAFKVLVDWANESKLC